MAKASTGRIEIVELLRGLAALAVTVFHLSNTAPDGLVRWGGAYGWLGVDIFFVISGFVVPYSIAHGFAGYTLRDFPRFIARRLLRLEPPYLASIALGLVLWHLSTLAPGFYGEQPHYEWAQVASHVLYLVPLTTYGWLQPVYWSLAYEFAFYLAIGALFPWIGRAGGRWRWALVASALAAGVLAGVLPTRSLLFVLGFASFKAHQRTPGWDFELASIAVIASVAFATLLARDTWVTAMTGSATAAAAS